MPARLRRFALIAAAAGLAFATGPGSAQQPATSEAPPAIFLPEPFAIELPIGARGSLAPNETPLADLLGAAIAGPLRVTHDLIAPAKLGVTPITFTAWAGAPNASAVVTRTTMPLLMLPYGQTPIGVSVDERASASNNIARVVRDEAGTLHVAWLEARPGGRISVMYRRGPGRQGSTEAQWDVPAQSLSDERTVSWNAYVGLTVIRGGVMASWQGADGIVLRRIMTIPGGWRMEPPIVTRIPSAGHEMGPALVARGDEIAMLTPAGLLARSSDRGATWISEQTPFPPGKQPKNTAMDADSQGRLHIAFAWMIDDQYWELRYVRRETNGTWADAQNVLADVPRWQRPTDAGQVLADFPSIRIDHRDGIHVAWHGTATTRKFGADETHYRYRAAAAGGGWEAWRAEQTLWPNDPARSQGAYGPTLTLDPATDTVIALSFFVDGGGFEHTGLRFLRGGELRGDPLVLSKLRTDGATMPVWYWFPSALPAIHRPAAGGAWIDVLQNVQVRGEQKPPHVIVYQTADLGGWLDGSALKTASERSVGIALELPDPKLIGAGIAGMLLLIALTGVVTYAMMRRNGRRRMAALAERRTTRQPR